MSNVPKILTAIPTYNSVQPEPFFRFLLFSQETGKAERDGRYEVRFCVPGPRMKTVTARNVASNLAISMGADYLFLVDDDMLIESNGLDILLRRNADIVSPIFFRSTEPIDPLVYEFDELQNRTPMYNYPKNALFETPAGNGTGVMLIKTDVLKAVGDPIWRGMVDPEISEDLEFCDRARKCGFKSWCDSTIEAKQMSLPVAIGSEAYEYGRLTR